MATPVQGDISAAGEGGEEEAAETASLLRKDRNQSDNADVVAPLDPWEAEGGHCLYDCCEDAEIMWCSICCPCVVFARNMTAIDEGSFVPCCLLFACSGFCVRAPAALSLGSCLGAWGRDKIAQHINFPAKGMVDNLCGTKTCWCCCSSCVLGQEARVLKKRGLYPPKQESMKR